MPDLQPQRVGSRLKRTPLLRKTPLATRKGFAAMTAIRQAAKAAQEKGRAVAIKPSLRRSKAKPATAAQKRRWVAARERGCVACYINEAECGRARASYARGLEIHHLLSGGRRRGHSETVCLCHYHHQAKRLIFTDVGYKDHAVMYGPSLERESRRFHEFYGTDDELLERQNAMIRDLPVRFEQEPSE